MCSLSGGVVAELWFPRLLGLLSVSAPAAASSTDPVAQATAAVADASLEGDDGPVELNPDGSKKLTKSQQKKLDKMAAINAKKAEKAGASEAAKQVADAERIAKAKAVKLVQDPSLKEAKRVSAYIRIRTNRGIASPIAASSF